MGRQRRIQFLDILSEAKTLSHETRSMPLNSDTTSILGVVPVFVNAGAALLPAILAGVATVLSVLFKPRELFRLCVRKPWMPILVIILAIGSCLVVPRLIDRMTASTPAVRARATTQTDEDWTAVALELIRQDERDWRKTWLEERDRRVAVEQRVEQLARQMDTVTDESDTPNTTGQETAPVGEDVR